MEVVEAMIEKAKEMTFNSSISSTSAPKAMHFPPRPPRSIVPESTHVEVNSLGVEVGI